jgi:molecular chaperone DnaK (HSP70)
MSSTSVRFSFLVLFLVFGSLRAGPVVGIDFGSHWYKVAMIQGQNLDLVLDGAGDRKRNTLVGIHDDQRVFGRDAEAMVSS